VILDGLDLVGYCRSLHYDSAGHKDINNPTADDWQCVRPMREKIEMTKACNWQYGRNDLTAHEDSPGVWSCLTPQKVNLGGISELTRYCQKLGYDTVKMENGEFYCAYNNPPPDLGLDQMTQACIWKYHRVDAVARTDNPKDPLSWLCYAPRK